MSISAQLINLDEMNPFVRWERIPTIGSALKKKGGGETPQTGNANHKLGPGPRSKTQGNKSLVLEPHTREQDQGNNSQVVDPPKGRCLICRSHYCPKENVKLKDFFVTQLIQMMETLQRLVKLHEHGAAWEEGLAKSILEKSLPLCTLCARSVHSLWSLDSQLELIQGQISIIVQKIKGAVWLSTKLHKEKEVVKAKFMSAAFQVYPSSSLQPKASPVQATGKNTRATEKLKTVSTPVVPKKPASKSKLVPPVRQGSKLSPVPPRPTLVTAQKNVVQNTSGKRSKSSTVASRNMQNSAKKVVKRPGPASKTFNTTCFKKTWASNAKLNNDNTNKLDDVIEIKLEKAFEDDDLPSCPSELDHQEDVHDFDYPVSVSIPHTSPIPPMHAETSTSSHIALNLPNFENEDDEEQTCPAQISSPPVAKKKKRVRRDPLEMLVEESKDLIIDCGRPRKCAEAAKLSIALQNQSQEEIEEGDKADGVDHYEANVDKNDPDVEQSIMDNNSSSDEEFTDPVKTTSTNPKRRQRGHAKPDEPKKPGRKRTRPNRVPKPKRSGLRKDILLALEYEAVVEFVHLDIKVTKDESSGLWKCWGCGDFFPSQGRARRHIVASHTKVEAKCTYCPLIFESKSDLTKHTSEAHTGERLYVCNTCDKTYNNRGSLHWHTVWVHGRITRGGPHKYLPCNICNKRFLNSGKLTNHMRTHTGQRPFICEICSHASSTLEILKRHVKRCHDNPQWHPKHSTTIKPNKKTFSCNICERMFFQNFRLTKHMLTHTSDRQFKCEICEHRAVSKISLRRHMSLKHPNRLREKGEVSGIQSKDLDVIEEIMEKREKILKTLPPRGRISAINFSSAVNLSSPSVVPTSSAHNLVGLNAAVQQSDATPANADVQNTSSCSDMGASDANSIQRPTSFQACSVEPLQPLQILPESLIPLQNPPAESYFDPSFLQYMQIMSSSTSTHPIPMPPKT